MTEQMTINQMIRQAQKELGLTALNSDIKRYCQTNFGVEPLSQQIYGCLGAEFERLAQSFSARQLTQTRKHINTNFDGDFEHAFGAMKIVGAIK